MNEGVFTCPTGAKGKGAEMRISAAYPSKYLKAADLQGRQVMVTIDHVTIEEMQGDTKESKPVVYFIGKDKGVVLNKTNASVIAAAYGDESDDWHGKQLGLKEVEVSFGSDLVPSIRVFIPKTPPAQRAAAPIQRPAPVAPPAERPFGEEQTFTEDSIPFDSAPALA